MRNLIQFAVKFTKREDGPTAVEYAAMFALVIVVCIGALKAVGDNAKKTSDSVWPGPAASWGTSS